jgi:uncharacterized protein
MAIATFNENRVHSSLTNNLAQIHKACVTFGVKQLYVFGSITNTRFNSESDVDFLVQFKPSAYVHYFDNYMNLHYRLAEIMLRKIDLITEDSLINEPNLFFNQSVNDAKILIFDEN